MKPIVNESLSVSDIDRIIQMAWEDRTSFDVIRTQFKLTPGEVIAVMRLSSCLSSGVSGKQKTLLTFGKQG